MIALLLLGVFVGLLLLEVPVAFAMGIAACVVLLAMGTPLVAVPQMVAAGVQSFPLMAVPFFILAGAIMNTGGITKRIFDFCVTVVGHLPGGLGHVCVIAECIFSGISGSAAADAAGLGVIEVEAMAEHGYRRAFAAALAAAASVLGPLIPPSIVMVLYAVQANVSIASMFAAGMVPGIVTAIALMVTIWWLVKTKREPAPVYPRSSLAEVWASFRRGFLALIAPFIILTGMFTGIVTPTEAGILAIVYSLVVSWIYGDLRWQNLKTMMMESTASTAQVMFMFANASLFAWVATALQLPQLVANTLLALPLGSFGTILVMNIIMLITGMFLETMAGLVILVPVFLPVIAHIGMDPVHFGVMASFNMTLGIITPPMAACIYIVASFAKVRFVEIVKAVIPFLVAEVAALLLVSYIPWFSLWLPRVLKL